MAKAQFSLKESVLLKLGDSEGIPAKVIGIKYVDSRIYYDLVVFYEDEGSYTEIRHINSIFVTGRLDNG